MEPDPQFQQLRLRLLRFAQSLGLTVHDAEDVVQDGLVALQKSLADSKKKILNPQAYAFKIVRNNVARRLRVKAMRNEVEFAEDHPASDSEPEDDKFQEPVLNEAFQEAYKGLTETERTLIRKRYVERRTLREIASELDCTPQNAWKLINTIISRKLRPLLKAAVQQSDPHFAEELFARQNNE